MPEPTINEVVSKRVDLFEQLGKILVKCSADLKELKYQVNQYDAKVRTLEGHIMERKTTIKELDEAIRLKQIEVSGSFNSVRDSLTSREEALVKRMAELEVREQQVKSRSEQVEALMTKVEKAMPKKSEQAKVAANA